MTTETLAAPPPPPPSSGDDQTQANSKAEIVQPADAPMQSPPSVFVNSEPMREDQVQNAVKFLSHPKVRGSPVMYRRSFLERKGLTKEEIDEAFRRVPDSSPSAQATTTNLDGQVKPASNTTVQALQPAAAAPVGVVSAAGTLTRSRFHWYHAVFAVGFLAASGAGTVIIIKKAIIPRFKSWIRKVVLEEEEENRLVKKKPSLAEEAEAAVKAAIAAASDVARANQELLNSKIEEKKYFEELTSLLGVQAQEIRSLSTAIRRLEGQEDRTASYTNPKQTYANGRSDYDSHSVRSSSPPARAEPSAAPHPKSYMEIMAMVQRGEKPPNVRDINDMPPNPNQQISNPRLAPRPKPWEVNGSSQVLQSQDNGVTYQFNGESNTPFCQKKNARITEIETEDEHNTEAFGRPINEQPVQRTWVPPQPPPVAMPEAAEAIRRPKPLARKDQLTDDELLSRSSNASDELQRITKISESGGAVAFNGGESGAGSSEIIEEQEQVY